MNAHTQSSFGKQILGHTHLLIATFLSESFVSVYISKPTYNVVCHAGALSTHFGYGSSFLNLQSATDGLFL